MMIVGEKSSDGWKSSAARTSAGLRNYAVKSNAVRISGDRKKSDGGWTISGERRNKIADGNEKWPGSGPFFLF
ncbi:hypothetical protein V2V90_23380 (plasmid) [Agrobacterium leguminum]|uniref:hypothetical protein n=1 Tax=Agrobacterium leguminum TaxID=2792015 RepID=UPI0030CB95BE